MLTRLQSVTVQDYATTQTTEDLYAYEKTLSEKLNDLTRKQIERFIVGDILTNHAPFLCAAQEFPSEKRRDSRVLLTFSSEHNELPRAGWSRRL